MTRLGSLRAKLAAIVGAQSGSLGTAARDQLVRRVYLRVHCGFRDDNEPASNRVQLARLMTEAQRALADITTVFGGWAGIRRTDRGTILQAGDGIEVLCPENVQPSVAGHHITVRAPAVAINVDARWLHWIPGQSFPAAAPARLYLNARPDAALTAWVSVTQALAHQGLACRSKVAASAALQRRADSIVIYLDDGLDGVRSGDALDVILAAADPRWLAGPVPGFACRVAPGIGLGVIMSGDELGTRTSFGYAWATRLVDAYAAGDGELTAVLTALGQAWDTVRGALRGGELSGACLP